MRYTRQILLLSVATVAVWFGTARLASSQQPSSQPVPALTAIEKRTFYDQNGNLKETHEVIRAFRSDGSTATIVRFRAPDGGPAENRIIVDLSHGRRMTATSMANAVTTYRLPADQRVTTAQQDCSKGEPAGDSLGYPVRKTVRDRGGSMRLELWQAPSLGCLDLKGVSTMPGPSGNAARTEHEVKSIALGEPDPAYFTAPSDYREMAPSEVRNAIAQRYPQLGPPPPSAELDQAYNSHQR